MPNKKDMPYLVAIVVIALILVSVFVFVTIPLTAKNDCLHYKEQSAMFAGFYLTKWQVQECAGTGVDISSINVIKL